MKTLVAVLFVFILGVWAVYAQTLGFTVVTSESARRIQIAQAPLQLPEAQLQDASTHIKTLTQRLAEDGRVAIVNFMFTRCISVCVDMGDEFQQLQKRIIDEGLADKIRLVSISFDSRDTPEWLERYQDRMKAKTAVWDTWLAVDEAERDTLLKRFGIVVIPAPMGQFEHNTAYHVVLPDGGLTRIVDIYQPDIVLHYAREQAALLAQEH